MRTLKNAALGTVLVGIIIVVIGGLPTGGILYVEWWGDRNAEAKAERAANDDKPGVEPKTIIERLRENGAGSSDPYVGPQDPSDDTLSHDDDTLPDDENPFDVLEPTPTQEPETPEEQQQEQAVQDGYDLNCPDFTETDFAPIPGDPHGLDGSDNDGIACES
jgi:hypothetical protein